MTEASRTYAAPELDAESVTPLLVRLDELRAEATTNEEEQKAIKAALRDALGMNGVAEFETATHKFSMTYPEARSSISKEKLLLSGVEAQKIIDATTYTDVAPYVNVRAKKAKP